MKVTAAKMKLRDEIEYCNAYHRILLLLLLASK